MSSSGVILLNLENRNAAEFESISVPGSYDKALGAATAGSYITVYKWLYNGFAMTASLCTAEDKTDYISLVDKTNGGELKVYSDDTVTLVGAVAPEPPGPEPPGPVTREFPAYHVYTGSATPPYTMIVQRGHFEGTEFSADWTPSDFIADGDPITLNASTLSAFPYVCEGVLAISYTNGWIFTATESAREYSSALLMWLSFQANTTLEQIDKDAQWIGKYYCADSPQEQLPTLPLEATENKVYTAGAGYSGFNPVTVNVGSPYSEQVEDYMEVITPMYEGGYEYKGYIYDTQLITDLELELLADVSSGADSAVLSDSISNFSGVLLQGVYGGNKKSNYNTTLLYLNPELNVPYWAGMKDRNNSYTCYVTFTSATEVSLGGNKQVLIYGIP